MLAPRMAQPKPSSLPHPAQRFQAVFVHDCSTLWPAAHALIGGSVPPAQDARLFALLVSVADTTAL